jgi:hypothetical protein
MFGQTDEDQISNFDQSKLCQVRSTVVQSGRLQYFDNYHCKVVFPSGILGEAAMFIEDCFQQNSGTRRCI